MELADSTANKNWYFAIGLLASTTEAQGDAGDLTLEVMREFSPDMTIESASNNNGLPVTHSNS